MKQIKHVVSDDKQFELVVAEDTENGVVIVNLGIGNLMIALFEEEFQNLKNFLEENDGH